MIFHDVPFVPYLVKICSQDRVVVEDPVGLFYSEVPEGAMANKQGYDCPCAV